MKKLQASNNKNAFAIVDDDVFETIKDMGLKFRVQPNGYFRSTTKIKLSDMTEKKYLYLHRFVYIIKTREEPTSTIDHADIDKSNNQFSNLRLASRREQSQHRGKQKNNTSGYTGVSHKVDKHYKNGYRDYWYSQIHKPDGKIEVKRFKYTDEGLLEAIRWRDQKVREYYKEFAVTNFPDENQ